MNGEFSYDPATRTLRGILLPFGEASRTSASGAPSVMFSADAIDLPRDPAVVTLNRHHNRFDPIGRATFLEKRKEGVYAEFAVANTAEGDAYLNTERGTLRKLSAEVAGLVAEAGRALRGKLTGAGVVTEGAFASAALFAIESAEHHDDTYTDADGVTWRRVEDTQRTTEDDGTTTTTTTVVESTTTDDTNPDAAQAEENPNETEEEFAMANIVPGGTEVHTEARPTLNGLFAAIATGDPEQLRNYRQAGDLFALATVQHSGPGGVTIGADTQETAYLGELWQRAPYNRRFVPLLTQAILTAYTMRGWRWVTQPTVDDYAGNTAEVPSNAVDTEPVDVTASRLAGGHRLDRRYRDFGDQGVIASYLEKQAEDYKRKTDAKALGFILASSTVTAPGSIPAGVAKGLAAIVDGALGVIQTENRPGFAIVAADLWRDIALMKADDKLAFLNAGFGLEEGDVDSFKIVPAPVGGGVGQIPAGRVLVGAKEGGTFYELGESPIRVEGVVPGNGAEDVAVFGYWATLAKNAQAFRSVQTV